MTLLEVKNLTVYFKTFIGISKVVEDVNFTLEKGESLALVGESGSGKTTVLKTILGVLPPNAIVKGELLFKNTNLLSMGNDELSKIRGMEITYIPQEPLSALNPFYTIEEHFLDRLILSGKPKAGILSYIKLRRKVPSELKKTMLEYLEKVKIPDPERVLKSYPMQLSGGMLQRILIALAIVSNPSILLADEPTTALDVVTQKEILELLKELQKDLGLSIIYVTHDLGVARAIADKVIVMYAGHMVEEGITSEVLAKPLHPYTKGLVDSIPKLVGGGLHGIEGGLIDYYNPPSGCRFHPRCPKAMSICRETRPKPFIVNGRKVYCWLYGE
ncbi:MAG: ABC transporter ATP-binding protein [Thermoprotei archaeon]|nr:ABC transporter ATP-binding protein [Thermoprotei archaeon]